MNSYGEAIAEASAHLTWGDVAPEVTGKRTTGGWLSSCHNPDHPDRNPSCQYTDEGPHAGKFRCWSCGATGDYGNYLETTKKLGKKEALSYLQRLAGINPEEIESTHHRKASWRGARTVRQEPKPEHSGYADIGNQMWNAAVTDLGGTPAETYLTSRCPAAIQEAPSENDGSSSMGYTSQGSFRWLPAGHKHFPKTKKTSASCPKNGKPAGVILYSYQQPDQTVLNPSHVEWELICENGQRPLEKVKRTYGKIKPGAGCCVWIADGTSIYITEGAMNAFAAPWALENRAHRMGQPFSRDDDIGFVIAVGGAVNYGLFAEEISAWTELMRSETEACDRIVLLSDQDKSGDKAVQDFMSLIYRQHLNIPVERIYWRESEGDLSDQMTTKQNPHTA